MLTPVLSTCVRSTPTFCGWPHQSSQDMTWCLHPKWDREKEKERKTSSDIMMWVNVVTIMMICWHGIRCTVRTTRAIVRSSQSFCFSFFWPKLNKQIFMQIASEDLYGDLASFRLMDQHPSLLLVLAWMSDNGTASIGAYAWLTVNVCNWTYSCNMLCRCLCDTIRYVLTFIDNSEMNENRKIIRPSYTLQLATHQWHTDSFNSHSIYLWMENIERLSYSKFFF